MTRGQKLTDSEVAVIRDSLAMIRDQFVERGTDAPNIKSAIEKVDSLLTPSTYGLFVGVSKWGALSDQEIIDVSVALAADWMTAYGQQAKDRMYALMEEADAEVKARGLNPDEEE